MELFPNKINFASDNYSGMHPSVLEWIQKVNARPAAAYGNDEVTQLAIQKLKAEFGEHVKPYFVWNGTAANVLALKTMLRPYEAVVGTDIAHIHTDECGAPESQTGSKVVTIPSPRGKLTVNLLRGVFDRKGNPQAVQPKVISISQTTECGTVYSLPEIRALADFAHKNGAYLHMDGARVSNAAAALGCTFKEMTTDCGVDALSFGGTKNGLMGGEAIIFFRPELAENFKYIRKQGMQLASKMRFISCQFVAYLTDDLWKKNALKANKMALLLAQKLSDFQPKVVITQPVEANVVFAQMPREMIDELLKDFYFYIWNENKNEVRLMCSYDTEVSHIEALVQKISKL